MLFGMGNTQIEDPYYQYMNYGVHTYWFSPSPIRSVVYRETRNTNDKFFDDHKYFSNFGR